MTQTIGLKKKALICLLAAAMGASALAGGILLDTNAAEVSTTALVTATEGTTVTGGKSYTTAAKDFTTSEGLYVAAPEDKSLSYGVTLNGIFTGSTGIKAYFPGEGFWNPMTETVVTVTSVANPDDSFQVHVGGQWQRYAYVTYDWNGQTLYRSIDSSESYDVYYYTENGVKHIEAVQYLPIQGNMSGDAASRTVAYFGFEMQADGVFNVRLVSTKGGMPTKTIASFCEDKATFEPTSEASGTESNLPKLDLSEGYTIEIENSDADNSKSFDLLIESIATSETGDPYSGGTTYAFNTETLAAAPEFYTKWQTTPILTVGDYDYLNSSYVGAEVTLPVPSVTLAGAASSFTGTVTVTDSAGEQTVTDGKYTVRSVGKHTVRYTQDESTIEITFNAYDAPYDIQNVIQNVQGTVDTAYESGIMIDGTDGNDAYSGTIAGSFSGDAEIEFTFPESANLSNGGRSGGKFTYIVRDLQGEEVFRIVYKGLDWHTSAYVVYGDEVRGYSKSGNIGGSWVSQAYFYREPTGEEYFALPCLNNYTGENRSGTMRLFWEGDVLCVGVDNRDSELITIARFDGSQKPSDDVIGADGYMLSTEEDATWGLPLLYDRLSEGYTIDFAFNGIHGTDEAFAVFQSVNGISLANKSNLTSDYVFSASVNPDQASVSGDDVYVAEGLHAGSVRRVYSYAFTGAAAGFEGSWGLRHTVVETDLDTFHNNSTVGDHTVTIPADGGDDWAGMDTSLNLHIETAWELTFDLKNGQVAEGSADPIIYSEHTKFLLSVPEVERAFWKFEGWSTQSDLGDTWDGSFDAWSGDMTLYAKWADVTPATVVLADGVASYTEVLVQDGSFTISTKDVVASDAAQPDAVTLTVQYRQVGTADWTTLEGESVTIDNLAPGKWEIMYTVGDGVNEATTLTRTVAVIERAAPVVTVGDIATEAYVGFAVSVSATAQDADGNAVNVSIIVVDENGKQYAVGNGAFTPDKAGVYTVSFTAQDGSLIGYASHRVTVIDDTQNPDLAVDFADMTVERGSVVTLPAGTAQDNADPNVTVTVSVAFGTEQVELSGNTFTAEKEGTYTITWTAQDSAGNTATVTAYVTVQPAGGGSNVGLIIGIVAGVVVVAAAAVIVSVIVIRKKKVKAGTSDATENDSDASENK